MGWMILNIAFGIVALWLLAEVLLQYKARLRWRALAFVGFLGVVTGVQLGSVVVIGIGAVAFAVGQTQVTLSFRRGFAMGWALSARPGAGKERTADPGDHPAAPEPRLEVSDLRYEQRPDDRYEQHQHGTYQQTPDTGYGQDPGGAYGQGQDTALLPGPDRAYGQDPDRGYAQGQDTGGAYRQDPDRAYAQDSDRAYRQDSDRGFEQDLDNVFEPGPRRGFESGPGGFGADRDTDRYRTPETVGMAYEPAPAPPSAPPPYLSSVPVYEPEPMPDDTGQYGVYGHDTGTGYPQHTPTDTPYTYTDAPQAYGYDTGYDTGQAAGPADYGYDAYAGYDQQQYAYDAGQHHYPGHPAGPPAGGIPDAYPAMGEPEGTGAGSHSYSPSAIPGLDGVAAAGEQVYGMPQAGQYDPYGQQYGYPPQDPPPGPTSPGFQAGGEPEWPGAYPQAHQYGTPAPGAVWMPQQRDTDGHYDAQLPPEQQYPYQQGQADGYQPGGYEPGYDEQQYRY